MRSARGAGAGPGATSASTASSSAASATPRVSVPTVSKSCSVSGKPPARATRPDRRLEAHEAGVGRGAADRAAAVGAERRRHEPRRDARRRAAARPARRQRGVPGVARRAVEQVRRVALQRQLGDVGLADEDGAGGAEPRHGRLVGVGAKVRVGAAAPGGGQAAHEQVVLDGHRHAVEPGQRRPGPEARGAVPRRRAGGFGARRHHRVQGRVEPGDAVEAGVGGRRPGRCGRPGSPPRGRRRPAARGRRPRPRAPLTRRPARWRRWGPSPARTGASVPPDTKMAGSPGDAGDDGAERRAGVALVVDVGVRQHGVAPARGWRPSGSPRPWRRRRRCAPASARLGVPSKGRPASRSAAPHAVGVDGVLEHRVADPETRRTRPRHCRTPGPRRP